MFTQLFAESEGPIVTWEDEEDEFLARAVYEHMQLNSEKVGFHLLLRVVHTFACKLHHVFETAEAENLICLLLE